MSDPKRIRITGPGIAVRGNDIDTDRIIPARYLRCVTFDGIGVHAFEDDRAQLKEQGKTHPFDRPENQKATVLLSNKNFGCGSSREHAPQSLMRWNEGIKAVIAESFAEIFFGNCTALGIPAVVASETDIEVLMKAVEADADAPVTVDIEARKVTIGDVTVDVTIPDGARGSLMSGKWDSTAELLEGLPEVEKQTATLPYFNWG